MKQHAEGAIPTQDDSIEMFKLERQLAHEKLLTALGDTQEHIKVEESKKGHTISDERKAALNKQYEIILGLPQDTIESIYGQLMAAATEQHERGEPFDVDRNLRGILFETMVQQEFKSRPDEIADILLALAHMPERFDMENTLAIYRNSDLAYIDFDKETNTITINAAGECKLGKLNHRAFQQLDGGFKEGLLGLMHAISKTNNGILKQHGLEAFAGVNIKFSPEYKQILYIPSNRDLDNPDSLVDEESFEGREEDLKKIHTMLKNKTSTSGKLDIQQSCFSGNDIFQYAQAIKAVIEKTYDVNLG